MLLLLLNGLVKGSSYIAPRDEPVLAAGSAFRFTEVSQGIGDGTTECVTGIALGGLKVGEGNLFDGAKRGGARWLGRCPRMHVV